MYQLINGSPNHTAARQPIQRNGPKAMVLSEVSWSLCKIFLAAIQARPRTQDINIMKNIFFQSMYSPNTKISLMSPPPMVSFPVALSMIRVRISIATGIIRVPVRIDMISCRREAWNKVRKRRRLNVRDSRRLSGMIRSAASMRERAKNRVPAMSHMRVLQDRPKRRKVAAYRIAPASSAMRQVGGIGAWQ